MAKKVSTIIFIILFVICATAALILINLRVTLLNVDFIKTGLIKADFYNQAINKVLTSIINTNGEEGSFSFGPIEKDQLVGILNQALPPSNLQSQIETGLTNFNQFLSGERDNLGIIFNLGDAKKTLEEQLTDNLGKEWENLPVCSGSNANSDELATDCKPAGMTAPEQVQDFLYNSDSGLFKNLPDNLNIEENWVKNLSVFDSTKNIYRFIDLGGKISLIGSLFLLLTIILLNLKPMPRLLKISGITLIIPSGLVLVGTIVFHIIFFAFATTNLKLGLPENLMPLNVALIKAIIGRYLIQTEIVAGIFVVIAVTLLILANYFYKKSFKSLTLAPAPTWPQSKNMDSLPSKK
ncbi:MAG: hypothetical protein PHW50_02150 [Patescibacteria group bacterium]|nr:hypothetical protein [Patescibacteria group bacterium]